VIDLVRSIVVPDLEVTGRTLEGSALRWDTLYRVTDDGRRYYQEGFRRGAFTETLATRPWHELRPEHWDDRIGTVRFEEAAEGLVFTVDLRELSLTARPQYGPDAKVLAMRSEPRPRDPELDELLAWVPPQV
jgi:hypothetical protein